MLQANLSASGGRFHFFYCFLRVAGTSETFYVVDTCLKSENGRRAQAVQQLVRMPSLSSRKDGALSLVVMLQLLCVEAL